MSFEKFTPGEWVTRPGNTTVMDKKSTPIAMVYRAEYYRSKEESFANAALIKAAPEMYRVLNKCQSCIQHFLDGRWDDSVEGETENLLLEIENLLNKARGEE